MFFAAVPAVAGPPGEAFTAPFGFPLLETSIEQIRGELGPAPIVTAGHHEDTICYVWPRAGALVTFIVGQEGIGASFEARKLPDKVPANCITPSGSRTKQKLNVGGLHLGMTKANFIKLVGPAKPAADGRLEFTVWRKDPIPPRHEADTEPSYYDVGIGIKARFINGLLTDFVVWKTVST
jgi:hypothetical protein